MKLFDTEKSESFSTRWKKWVLNFFPAYRGTGAWACFISSDWKEVHVKLSLNWTTRNYVGSVFGGSLYGALDPIYMIQLLNILDNGRYVVWDKSACIRFLRPVKQPVKARFLITEELLGEIEGKVAADKEYVFELPVEFLDEAGKSYVRMTRELYVADKEYYKAKRAGVKAG